MIRKGSTLARAFDAIAYTNCLRVAVGLEVVLTDAFVG